MLTEHQRTRVWESLVKAEVRSLYFGDLASRNTKRKQIITGVSFFLSSGAAATLAAQSPSWIPLVMSGVVAVLIAYSIAVGLDKAAATMAKLHYTWNQLAADYDHLWDHWDEDDAEEVLGELVRRSRDASELGTTEAPYNPSLLEKWTEHVYAQYNQSPTTA
ncbi:MAG: hypothetical protein HY238_23525 [Acidobacteria bacterium]|nr:hypothetical protein [Acidobacteriota bacterium]